MARVLVKNLGQQSKNLFINGNFDLWQRSTSTLITASQYVADRIRTFNNGTFASVATVSRSTDVPTLAQSGFQSQYSHLITKTGGAIVPAAADYIYHSHKIEGNDYAAIHGAKNIRIQFWVKSSIAGIYTVGLGNNNTTRAYAAEYTINAVNTWEKKTLDLITDNTGTWVFDNSGFLEIGFALALGSNYRIAPGSWITQGSLGIAPASTNQVNWAGSASSTTFQLAQVAVFPVAGGVGAVIPFERAGKTIQQESAMCQRYCINPFVSIGLNSTDGSGLGSGMSFNSSLGRVYHAFPTTMRTMPTMTFSAVGDFVVYGTSGTPTAVSALSLNEKGVNGVEINMTSTVFGGAGFAAMLRRTNLNGYMFFDAEL